MHYNLQVTVSDPTSVQGESTTSEESGRPAISKRSVCVILPYIV